MNNLEKNMPFLLNFGFSIYWPQCHVVDYKNLSRLCTGTGKSIRVSKICSPRRGLPGRRRCKSLTREWFPCLCTKLWLIIFLLPLSILITKPQFLLSKTTSKCFLLRKRRQLGLIMMSRHCMIYYITRCSLKKSCLYKGRTRERQHYEIDWKYRKNSV